MDAKDYKPMSNMKKFAKALYAALLCTAMINNAMAAVVTYYHNDISGSPIAATDAAGNLKWKESYKPYGDKLTRSAASSDNDIGFHGKAYDDSTGLSYMGARYYDATLGRFMGVDPVNFQPDNLHSFNRYTYASNNPYKYIDPDGRYVEAAFEAASLALGITSFQDNLSSGNYGSAAVDAAGVAFDTVAAAIPFVPGAAGLGIGAYRTGHAAEGVANVSIASGKFDYIFGRVASDSHNAARSSQLAVTMKQLGIRDNPAGRELLSNHLTSSAQTKGNIIDSFSTKYGNFETRESFLMGPSGKGTVLHSTFQLLNDGSKKLTTTIPKN